MPRDMEETIKLSRLGRGAQVRASTVNEEARTVDLIWTTGAGVRRHMPGVGWCMEELEVSDAALRLDRLNGGAPLLNTHMDWALTDQIGRVERAWIKDGIGYATVRFSKRGDVEPIWRDVVDGIITNVSVGYRVHSYEVIDGEDGMLPRVVARDWEPLEISAVPIGADAKAGFRSEDTENPCVIERATPANSQKETTMSKDTENQGAAPSDDLKIEERKAAPACAPTPTPEAKPDLDAVRKEARAAERARVSEIRSIGAKLRIEDKEVEAVIEGDVTVDEARKRFIDAMAKADDKSGETRSRITVNQDEGDTRRALIGNAIEHRLAPSQVKLEDGAREYRGMSMLDIARDVLSQRGEHVRGMSRNELAGKALERGFHGTSDFPLILANVMGKRLRAAYEAAPQTFRSIVNQATLPDFKQVSRLQLGEFPALQEVPEGAEYKLGTTGESREQYALATYGRRMRFTRQMMINDDLSAFDRLVTFFGRAAANLESDVVWGIITGNPNMADGNPLFDAAHGNLATAGAISIANLGAAKTLMRKQTALDGATLLNIEPGFLAVPAELETVARQFLSSSYVPDAPGNINVFSGTMSVIAEPRLASLSGGTADDWYLFADPGAVDTIEVAYLEGEQGPQLEEDTEFSTDAISLKGRLDFGAKAIDWRGMVKNPGS